ncbi:MAG TPA: STAS domain-containing protein [Roseiflexaceae bacterium]
MPTALLILALIQGRLEYIIEDAIGVLLLGALLAAHLRGFRWTAQVMVIGATLLILAFAPTDPAERDVFAFVLLSPTILAAVLLPWYWGVGAFAVCFTGLAILWGGQGLLFDQGVAIPLMLETAGIALASVVSQTARLHAEDNARRAEESLARVERQAQELVEANDLMSEQLDQQGQLLELVTTLETPVVTLADGVLLAPVVGVLDTRRAEIFTSRLLGAISQQRARLVILDIVGMSSVDTAAAKALLETTQAVRLLGCDVILSGISAAVALTLTHLNINFDEIKSARSPQDALAQYGIWSGKPMNGAANMPYRYGTN